MELLVHWSSVTDRGQW